MSHRPYPTVDRARRQLARHQQPAPTPLGGLTVVQAAANLTANLQKMGLSAWLRSASVDAANAAICNGHRADQCPASVDITLAVDPYPRYMHGRCDPAPT